MLLSVRAPLLLVLFRFFRVRYRLIRRALERELLPPDLPADAADVEAWLRARDARAAPLHAGCESSVTWAAGSNRRRAKVCLLYFHGWGASPPEIDPVDRLVAAGLGGTLLRFRFTGHGLSPMDRGGAAMLAEQSFEQLQRDAATAFALGRLLGDRLVLVGCSTGATLALWLSAQQWTKKELAALVLVSPAFRFAVLGQIAWLCFSWLILLLPFAASRKVLHLVNGGPLKRPGMPLLPGGRGEAQQRVWTRFYPIESIVSLVALYNACAAVVRPARVRLPVLAFAPAVNGAVG